MGEGDGLSRPVVCWHYSGAYLYATSDESHGPIQVCLLEHVRDSRQRVKLLWATPHARVRL